MWTPSRREFLTTAAGAALGARVRTTRADETQRRARIAITFDLEMSREYPRRGMREWDYQKGNLNEATKKYALDAARLTAERGVPMHFFCVGRVLEQSDVGWLKEIVKLGHPVGNHTYDHVNVWAGEPAQTQFRFQRSPWLIRGMTVPEILRENIRRCTLAMQERIGVKPNGFRTPGGSSNALVGREDLQKLLLDEGFTWVSSKYPRHKNNAAGERPGDDVFESIVASQAEAQPFVYPTGLIEIPMSPISDVGAFRTGHWTVDEFLKSISLCLEWAIDTGSVFDLLCHPSIGYVEDPELRTVKHVCDVVKRAGDRAEIVSLDTIANGVKAATGNDK